MSQQTPPSDRPLFDTLNTESVVVVGNEDTTVRPGRPGLLGWIEKERARLQQLREAASPPSKPGEDNPPESKQ